MPAFRHMLTLHINASTQFEKIVKVLISFHISTLSNNLVSLKFSTIAEFSTAQCVIYCQLIVDLYK